MSTLTCERPATRFDISAHADLAVSPGPAHPADHRSLAGTASLNHDGATGNGYQDPFLAAWIDRRLGTSSNRPVLMLHVRFVLATGQTAQPSDVVTAAIIRRFGGHVVQLKGDQMIGAWGLRAMTPADPDRARAAAVEIGRSGAVGSRFVCLLHARTLIVAKDAAADPDDVVALALAGLRANGDLPNAPRDAILASAAFRSMCGWAGAMPISNSGSGVEAALIYALPDMARDRACDASSDRRWPYQDVARDAAVPLIARLDATGDLRPVLMAAAIAGPVFSAGLLARMMECDHARLMPALEAAAAQDVIRAEPAPPSHTYAFCDPRLHQALYDMVPAGDRLRLHRRAAEVAATGGCDEAMPAPAAMARHHQLGQDPLQSKRWLSKAAWQSIAAGETGQAVVYLQQALAEDGETGCAISPFSRSLLHLLGVQQAVMKGNGSNTVFESYQRSVALAGETATLAWGQEFRSLWLAQSCHVVKGEIRAALTIGNLLMIHLNRRAKHAETALGRRILIHRMQGLAMMLAGQLGAALSHYDAVHQNYIEEQHAVLRFAYGSDQAALAYAHQAWIHTLMDDHDLASRADRAARTAAERLAHPHTSAHVVAVSAIRSLTAGQYDEAVLAAHEARSIAVEHGFEYWVPWADVVLAADVARASPRAGYEMLEAAMAAYQATDAMQLCPVIYGLLSASALGEGRTVLALEKVDAGLLLMAQNGCVLYRPELLRVRARALSAQGDHARAHAALDAGYHDALRSGAALFAAKIVRDGMTFGRGQQQIEWHVRAHGPAGLKAAKAPSIPSGNCAAEV